MLKDQDPTPIYNQDMGEISKAITGHYDKGMVLTTPEADTKSTNDSVQKVKSEAELQQCLADAKAKGKMPLIVEVYTNNEPFYSDWNHANQKMDNADPPHIVTISDYQPGPPGFSASRQLVGSPELPRCQHS